MTATALEYPSQRVVATLPTRFQGGFIRGIAWMVLYKDLDIWFINAPPDAQPHTVARLLGAMMVNAHEAIAPQLYMTSRPPTFYLLPTGELRSGRGK